MSDAVELLACLGKLGAVDVVLHRFDPTLAVAVVQLPDDRRVIALERTYRPGAYVILDPTEEEMDVARGGDLWQLWGSERAQDVLDLRQSLGPDTQAGASSPGSTSPSASGPWRMGEA